VTTCVDRSTTHRLLLRRDRPPRLTVAYLPLEFFLTSSGAKRDGKAEAFPSPLAPHLPAGCAHGKRTGTVPVFVGIDG